MITIKPYGGLGNRMRAIDSVIGLVQAETEKIKLIWWSSDELNCRFSDLFIVPDFIELLERRKYLPTKINRRFGRMITRNILKAGQFLHIGYDLVLYEKELSRLKEKKFDFRQLNLYRLVFIETQHRFYNGEKLFRHFKPLPDIESRVNSLTSDFGDHTIGIHIRRTDNIRSSTASPVEAFIVTMKSAVVENNKTRFFLATDDPAVEKQLRQIFPGRISSFEGKHLGRTSNQAIKDALTDLLCLSRTARIIGSYWSSFSETAALIGGIELSIINILDKPL